MDNPFSKGQEYRRQDLHVQYGGQEQGGIATPAGYPLIMLFTAVTGEQYGYRDGWSPEGVFLYTGEGQRGDMQFVRGNRAIRDHLEQGRDIHLFQYVRSSYVEYVGQMVCIGYRVRKGPDVTGEPRDIIIFELKPIEDMAGES